MTTYYEVKISAENQQQADNILNSLLDKKLVTGGQFITTPARFLWKGKVTDMEYVIMTSYTTDDHKQALIADVKETSVEEVPMITFTEIKDLNKELAVWIEKTLQ